MALEKSLSGLREKYAYKRPFTLTPSRCGSMTVTIRCESMIGVQGKPSMGAGPNSYKPQDHILLPKTLSYYFKIFNKKGLSDKANAEIKKTLVFIIMKYLINNKSRSNIK